NPLSLWISGGAVDTKVFSSASEFYTALVHEIRDLSPRPQTDPSAVIGIAAVLVELIKSDPPELSLFLLFGCIPGSAIRVDAISSLLGQDETTTKRILDRLLSMNLISSVTDDRY